MRRVGPAEVTTYLQHDRIAKIVRQDCRPEDGNMRCHKWLIGTPAKRLIFDTLYGELLLGERRNVLDVGGGLTGLTRRLARRHQYVLVDILAHDHERDIDRFIQTTPELTLHQEDWHAFEPVHSFDIVIANDLFPNVDQRLELFLRRMLPRAREVRLSLTFYNSPRFYKTKRLDGDEILHFLAWDGQQTKGVLEHYRERIYCPDMSLFDETGESVYPNGRQVVTLSLRGDL